LTYVNVLIFTYGTAIWSENGSCHDEIHVNVTNININMLLWNLCSHYKKTLGTICPGFFEKLKYVHHTHAITSCQSACQTAHQTAFSQYVSRHISQHDSRHISQHDSQHVSYLIRDIYQMSSVIFWSISLPLQFQGHRSFDLNDT